MAMKRAKKASKKASTMASTAAGKKSGKKAYRPPAHYAAPKGDGDAAVQTWIGLLPAWQAERARRIDAAVTRAVPKLCKAVKWHCIWYGTPGQGWFIAVGSLKAYLKLVFCDGTALTPLPPLPLATKGHRALDLYEDDELDEAQVASWAKQGSKLPGWGKT